MMSARSSVDTHTILLNGRGGIRQLTQDEVETWSPAQGVLWVHLDYTNPHDRQWLEHRSGLDPLIVEALLVKETRPRATSVGEGLLIALRGVNLTPGAEPDDMVAIRLWVDRQRIISTQRRRMLPAARFPDRSAGHQCRWHSGRGLPAGLRNIYRDAGAGCYSAAAGLPVAQVVLRQRYTPAVHVRTGTGGFPRARASCS
jgi:hypothetical protein